ncbi:hypothetical protein FB548_2979 [Pseudoxanthomonas sp. 3HH-4]|nr:hypothetical protein FB548_2979 [Pseudoxanthomonas sp. 3HH-4]
MQRQWTCVGAGLLAVLCALPCGAQDALVPPAPVSGETAPPGQPACCVLPDGMLLVIEILDPISSAHAHRGDAFRLRLKEPVVVDDAIVLPAGIEGTGEIVHAEPSRGGGKPGELILAARRLQIGDQTIRLRGFKLGGAGRDTSGAALGASLGIGPFAHFIHGKEIEIPALTTATAKLAGSFSTEATTSGIAPDAEAPTFSTPDIPSTPKPPDTQE